MKEQKLVFVKKTKNNTKPIIVVSKKISQKAVERNKIKRRIREIIKKYPLEKTQGCKIIVAAPQPLDLSYQQLEEEIKKEIFNN
jgi:ribonuclease P protein component